MNKLVSLVKAEKIYVKVFWLSLSSMLVSVIVVFLMYLKTEEKIKEVTSKVVLLDNSGNVTTASVNDVSEADLKLMQSRATVRSAIEYMYSFSARNYDERIKMARSFYGASGSEIIQGYINSNVRQKVYTNNLVVDVAIKDINVSYSNGLIVGTASFEQSFINGEVVQKRILNASYKIVNDKVSNVNGFGLIVENWIIESL